MTKRVFRDCKHCGSKVHNRVAVYCSNRCQMEYQYVRYIRKWKVGLATGGIGVTARGTSVHVRRYLIEKYHNSCTLCGWNRVNTFSGKVPLEVDHIDGNSDNNTEENLRLICPNCHSLTASFRNLNRGKGRAWRRLKYIKNN